MKRPIPDASDAIADRDIGQTGAIIERHAPDPDDAVRDRDAGQTETFIKQVVFNCGNAFTDHDAGQVGAGVKCIITNAGDAIWDRDAGQTNAGIKRTAPNTRNAIADRDAGQVGAGAKCRIPDIGDAVRDRDAGQVGAIIECIIPDANDSVGYRIVASNFARQILDERGLVFIEQNPVHTTIRGVKCTHLDRAHAGATRERKIHDIGDTIWNRCVGKTNTFKECSFSNAGNAVADRDVGQVPTTVEGTANAIHAVGDCDINHAGAFPERRVTDVGDW